MKCIPISAFILSVCLVSVALGQQPVSTSDWTEFHRVNMLRFNPFESLLTVSNVGNLQLKWSYPTDAWVLSSPAVTNGVVFVGSYDSHVHAINSTTGAQRWSSEVTGGVY